MPSRGAQTLPITAESFSSDVELNSNLPERFKRNHHFQPQKNPSRPNLPAHLLKPFSARLSQYRHHLKLRNVSKDWILRPDIPSQEELSQPSLPDSWCDNNYALTPSDINLIDQPWPSTLRYLQVHYRLLREDAVGPLRDAIEIVREFPQANESDTPNIGIYDNATISGVILSDKGLGFRISFSLRRIGKQIRWAQSKRLLPGSLVALIPADNPLSEFLVAVIVARPTSESSNSSLEVDVFFSKPNDLSVDSRKKWIMVEAKQSYFEGHRHTLQALQKMTFESFPLADHLVNLKKNVEPPFYLPENFNENPLLDGTSIFDESQTEVFRRILTKSLALVQGPPGCGKTFVSTKAISWMLKNRGANDPPIVVASHTNHAVDQILRHVSEEWPDCFVRLGSRSGDPDIKKRTLYELRDSVHSPPSPTIGIGFKALNELRQKLKSLLKPLSPGFQDLSLEFLQEWGLLTAIQCKSIEADVKSWCSSGETSNGDNRNILLEWVGTALRPVQAKNSFNLFPEFEEADLDEEELDENEAEKGMHSMEENDLGRLEGEFIAFRDDVMGASSADGVRETVFTMVQQKQDLGVVKPQLRGAIFNYLVQRAKEEIAVKVQELAIQYAEAVANIQIGKQEQTAYKLSQFKVIGLTTTGLSKNRALLAAIQPKIVFIEEAGEILEAPVVAACIESLEHLVLVGDHKQLRPQCNIKHLQDNPFNLNISLFERLIRNEIEFSYLRHQRRMRPGIRRLLQPFYGDLIMDHPSVEGKENRPRTPGMSRHPVWFFHHQEQETRDEQLSWYNESEAMMVVEFIKYLIYNNVSPGEVTVLTFYNGQRRKIQDLIRPLKTAAAGLKIVTVDSYQGEENGIILLSMVRSNERGNIGFVANENRICVALSRAQKALYLFGNGELLCCESKAWSQIIRMLYCDEEKRRRIGFTLPLCCQKHGRKTWIGSVEDWENNAGGCEIICAESMPCGHRCKMRCHPYAKPRNVLKEAELTQIRNDHHDCKERCRKKLACSHTCEQSCVEACRCNICGPKTKPASHRPRPTVEKRPNNPHPWSTPEQDGNRFNPSGEPRDWKEFAHFETQKHDQHLLEFTKQKTLIEATRHLRETAESQSSFSFREIEEQEQAKVYLKRRQLLHGEVKGETNSGRSEEVQDLDLLV